MNLRRRSRQDVIAIPTIWVAFVLSAIVHLAALFAWTAQVPLARDRIGQGRPLAVDLAPAPARIAEAVVAKPPAAEPPRAVAPAEPKAVAPARPKAPRAPARPPTGAPRNVAPPVIAQDRAPSVAAPPAETPVIAPPAPAIVRPPERSQPPPPPATAPPPTDLSSYIEARRRARGEPASPSASGSEKSAEQLDLERRDRIIASNLGLDRTPTFGRDPANAGGIFQIKELRYDDAQFYFFGFDKDIRRNARQLIEVRRGNNSDIRIAVVRRMIEIIRESITGDFDWVSHRQGRVVTLSSRPEDNAGLEDFIMRDLFPETSAR